MDELRKQIEKNQMITVDNLYDLVVHYNQVTNKTDYVPSQEERYKFGKIVTMVKAINEYL